MRYCKFHPITAATQHCEQCEINLCDACTDESLDHRSNELNRRCFICQISTEALADSFQTEPFWRKMGDIYKYPIGSSGVAIIVLTAFMTALFASNLLLLLAPSVIITHYCFVCLSETAEGKMTAPKFEKSFAVKFATIFYIYLVIIVAIIAVSTVSAAFGPSLGILLGVFYVIAIPAAIMVIAIDESLSSAVNPSKLFSIVAATGASYFVMLLFIIIMMSSVAALNSVFGAETASFGSVLIQSLISNYYSIVIFHIMGYLVFQNQTSLGFHTRNSTQKFIVRSEEKKRNVRIETLIKAGEYTEAAKLCKQQIINDRNASLWQWERCFNIMFANHATKTLSEYSESFLNKLSSLDNHDKMADVYLRVVKRVPNFKPKNHAIRLEIASALHDIGQNIYAAILLAKFQEGCNEKAQIIKATELQSHIYTKIKGQEKKAASFRQQYNQMAQAQNL